MTAPNLEVFLGSSLCRELQHHAGGLPQLTRLSGAALLHVGMTDTAQMDNATRMHQLRAGLLVRTPTFTDVFGDEDELPAHAVKGARKCMEIIGRKTAMLAKVDLAGGRTDGGLGREERDRLKETCERLWAEGKVSVADTQALPVPEIKALENTKMLEKGLRGGYQLHKRRMNQNEVSALERATTRVRMGESIEQQREQLLARADVRAELAEEKNQLLEREGRKRQRTETNSEYDDLLHLTL